jgi:hypothetical protein
MEVSGQLHALAALPPRERAPCTCWIGGWMGPRAVLDVVVKRKIPNSDPYLCLILAVQDSNCIKYGTFVDLQTVFNIEFSSVFMMYHSAILIPSSPSSLINAIKMKAKLYSPKHYFKKCIYFQGLLPQ